MAIVAITASSRAASVQRCGPELAGPPAALASDSARQRSSVAMLTPTLRETSSTAELSGGSSRSTTRSLDMCPYLATVVFLRPQVGHPIQAATSLTQGDHPRGEPYAGMPHVRFCAGGGARPYRDQH